MELGTDTSVFEGLEPDTVINELVALGKLDRRCLGVAWCNKDKKSRATIMQKLTGKRYV